MDNLGDLLYIVFLIIIGIASLFSSGKKKKRSGQTLGQPNYEDRIPEDQQMPKKDFADILREMLGQEEIPPPEPEKKPVTPIRKKQKTVAAKKEQDRLQTIHRKEPDRSHSTLEESLLKDRQIDDHYMFEDESFQNIEELRKAIIYTEILNRKY